MAGTGEGEGEGEDKGEREGEAADFGSSANPEPNSRNVANAQTLNSIKAKRANTSTPRGFWLAS